MNEKKARQIVRERSGGVCERCFAVPAAEWHHRKNRSQLGRWTPANGLHLCSPCHRWITEHPRAAYGCGWAVKSVYDPAEVPVLIGEAFGPRWVFLDDDGETRTATDAELIEASQLAFKLPAQDGPGQEVVL